MENLLLCCHSNTIPRRLIKMSRYVLPIHRSKWEPIKINANCQDTYDNAEQRAYLASLKEASREMTKKWENSYETIMQRKEDEKVYKKKKNDLDNMRFYKQLMDEKRKEREQILADARDTFFKQMDEPKILLSALLCSEMLKEQQGQRDFNKKLKDEQKESDMEYVLYLRDKCREWKKEQAKKIQQNNKKNMEQSFLMKQRAEKEKQNSIDEKSRKTNWDKLNREIAQKELKALEEQEKKIKAKNQQIFIDNISMRLAIERDRKAEEEALRIKEAKLATIYNNTQSKMNEMCRQRQRQIDKYKNERRAIVRDLFIVNTAEIKRRKDELNKKANEEKTKRDKELVENENTHKQKVKEDKIQSHKDFVELQLQKLKDKETKLSNEIENRAENREYTIGLQEILRKEHYKKANDIKQFNLMQMKENAEKRSCEKAEKVKFYRDDRLLDMEAADIKFFEFAHKLLEECEAVGRPTQPLHKVIKDYKRRYMHPRENLYKNLNTHFPLFQSE